ncbi:uncharacterized protein [Narcine bancroftii]|uniref:uncharacterized protein isoform X3 n=1 Tax=Narcine bancroftii TaxID=1343680 RepID=UPI003831AF9C
MAEPGNWSSCCNSTKGILTVLLRVWTPSDSTPTSSGVDAGLPPQLVVLKKNHGRDRNLQVGDSLTFQTMKSSSCVLPPLKSAGCQNQNPLHGNTHLLPENRPLSPSHKRSEESLVLATSRRAASRAEAGTLGFEE